MKLNIFKKNFFFCMHKMTVISKEAWKNSGVEVVNDIDVKSIY